MVSRIYKLYLGIYIKKSLIKLEDYKTSQIEKQN